MLTRTLWLSTFLLFLAPLVKPCFAQMCMPGAEIKPDSPYSYIREEVKAFRWIRIGLLQSQKVQRPVIASDDPQRLHKMVELHTVLNNIDDAYTCADSLLTPFKDSKDESVHGSVDALLTAIYGTKENNAVLNAMTDSINKATKPEDIDEVKISKTLADIKSAQRDVMKLMMAGAKMSTFGILKMEGEGDDAKPTACANHRRTDAQEWSPKLKNSRVRIFDLRGRCAAILLHALNQPLPMSSN